MGNAQTHDRKIGVNLHLFNAPGMYQAHPRSVPGMHSSRLKGGAIVDFPSVNLHLFSTPEREREREREREKATPHSHTATQPHHTPHSHTTQPHPHPHSHATQPHPHHTATPHSHTHTTPHSHTTQPHHTATATQPHHTATATATPHRERERDSSRIATGQ